MPVDNDTTARFIAWLSDTVPATDPTEENGSCWLVSLTVCQVLDDEREEQHVEDLTGVVDHGGPWHHSVADDVLAEHGQWVRVGRWTFDRRYEQWRASVVRTVLRVAASDRRSPKPRCSEWPDDGCASVIG